MSKLTEQERAARKTEARRARIESRLNELSDQELEDYEKFLDRLVQKQEGNRVKKRLWQMLDQMTTGQLERMAEQFPPHERKDPRKVIKRHFKDANFAERWRIQNLACEILGIPPFPNPLCVVDSEQQTGRVAPLNPAGLLFQILTHTDSGCTIEAIASMPADQPAASG